MSSQSGSRSSRISELWSQPTWRYSGAGVGAVGLAIVGVADSESEGWNSQADLKDISEIAVWGSLREKRFEAMEAFRHVLITVSFRSSLLVLNGFTTSLATLITTSNLDASSAVGSRYK